MHRNEHLQYFLHWKLSLPAGNELALCIYVIDTQKNKTETQSVQSISNLLPAVPSNAAKASKATSLSVVVGALVVLPTKFSAKLNNDYCIYFTYQLL